MSTMPSVHGGVSEKTQEQMEETLKNQPGLEGQSDMVNFCIRYTLRHKFGLDVEDW